MTSSSELISADCRLELTKPAFSSHHLRWKKEKVGFSMRKSNGHSSQRASLTKLRNLYVETPSYLETNEAAGLSSTIH